MKSATLIICMFMAVAPLVRAQETVHDTTFAVEKATGKIIDEEVNTKIYPVPVVDNRFTISSDKSFVFVRLTNIIGQETTREKYNYPRNKVEISFSDVQQGIYLVIIEFEDKTRTVKKILIDSR